MVKADEPKIDNTEKAPTVVAEPNEKQIKVAVPDLSKQEKQDVTTPKEVSSKKAEATQSSTPSS